VPQGTGERSANVLDQYANLTRAITAPQLSDLRAYRGEGGNPSVFRLAVCADTPDCLDGP
jgi:hypothetical protein